MKIGISGCWHFANQQEFSSINVDGLNSRLAAQLTTFQRMLDISKKEGVKLHILNGDLFSTFNRIDTDVMHVVSDVMAEAVNAKQFKLIFNVGTHDVARRTGKYHALEVFQQLGEIVSTPGILTRIEDKIRLVVIPHVRDSDELLAALSSFAKEYGNQPTGTLRTLLIGHFSVEGGIADNETTRLEGVPLKALHADYYDYVFLNHFHMHQQLAENVMYVGSPMQHGFGEKATDKGFVIYDTGKRSVKFIELGAPLFLSASLKALNDADEDALTNNYFIVETKGAKDLAVVTQLQEAGANIRIQQEVTITEESPTAIDLRLSEQDAIKMYVEETAPSELNKQFLTDVGLMLFSGESLVK